MALYRWDSLYRFGDGLVLQIASEWKLVLLWHCSFVPRISLPKGDHGCLVTVIDKQWSHCSLAWKQVRIGRPCASDLTAFVPIWFPLISAVMCLWSKKNFFLLRECFVLIEFRFLKQFKGLAHFGLPCSL